VGSKQRKRRRIYMTTTTPTRSENSDPKVIVIFPAKNEEYTIENAIATAKQSYYKPDLLVVDAYSTDKTNELAIRAGATVIQQPTQVFPGKGIAMKAGLREAIKRSEDAAADIILF
jgi:glycosyltransferase involved in cell wall biosynthesis